MTNGQLESTLIEALDMLEQGMAVETILARYPEQAEQLGPYLRTAAELSQAARPAPLASQQASRQAFQAAAAELVQSRPPMRMLWLRRMASAALTLLFVFVAGGSLLTYSAGQALPGSTLYGAKLALEQVRLDLVRDPETAVDLVERHRAERVAEIAALIAEGREVQVSLAGKVEQMGTSDWVVAGIPVRIDAETAIQGVVEPGFEVEVSGVTQPTGLLAERVEVVVGRLPDVNEPEVVPDTRPTPTPQPDASATPQPTDERPIVPTPSLPEVTPVIPQPSPTTGPEAGEDGLQATPPAGEDADGVGDGSGAENSGEDQPGGEDESEKTPETGHDEDETPEAEHDEDETPEADHGEDETPEADHGEDGTPEPERD